jgi:hypothetical protein
MIRNCVDQFCLLDGLGHMSLITLQGLVTIFARSIASQRNGGHGAGAAAAGCAPCESGTAVLIGHANVAHHYVRNLCGKGLQGLSADSRGNPGAAALSII